MKAINKILFVLLGLILYSCDDIIEEDISDDTIAITYPKEGQEIEGNGVNFQWNALKGADDYRIQIYESSQNIVLDSLVTQNSFFYSLAPGTYQWRVRAENFAYESAYSFPASFILTETDDLTNQQVQLTTPKAGFYTNNPAITFSWSAINVASHYNFQLVNVTNGENIVFQQQEITGTSFTLPSGTITQDAQYSWQVQAVNSDNGTQTQFASRNFYLDTVVPGAPQNSSPLNNSQAALTQAVNFQWSVPADTGAVTSALNYTLQIASDQGFSAVVQTAGSTTPSYQYTFSTAGTYYWRVKAKDEANNEGAYSAAFKLIIQ